MNYYEELGLPPSASAEEIRQAYKSLARLLHPDRQSDAPLRKMAELQMTRLNDILAELTDPVRRLRYDAALQAAAAENVTSAPNRSLPRKLSRLLLGRLRPSAATIVWSTLLMITAVGFAFVFLYFEHDPGIVLYHPTEEGARRTPPPAPLPDLITAPAATPGASALPAARPTRGNEFAAAAQRKEEPPSPAPLALPPPQISAPSQHFETTQPRPASAVQQPAPRLPITQSPVPAPPPSPVAPPVHSLIGTWLYVKSKTEESGSTTFSYRPEYIEMNITEMNLKPGQKGLLGKYRGQFHVPDRPISSEVVLRFEGAEDEPANVFNWQSDDGASGRIRLNIISDQAVEVSWYTTRFGTAPKLASGTAVLHRD